MTVYESLAGDPYEPESLGLFASRESAQAALDAYVAEHAVDNGLGGRTFYGFAEIREREVQP